MVLRIVVGLVVATLLTGCGTSNKALKDTQPYLRIYANDADDMITLVRLASEASTKTDYNIRYDLTVRVPAGEYVLKAHDSRGGRYFSSSNYKVVRLTYMGPTLSGKLSTDEFDGGVFVDSKGQSFIYWFEDDDTKPVRVPLPSIYAVKVSTEIDAARVRAREARLERERQAAAQKDEQERLAAAKKLKDEQEWQRLEKLRQERKVALAAAILRDRVSCAGEQCDRAFAQGQAYLLKQADMRIQVATPTLIETYNASEDGRISMRLLKVPSSGGRWEIVMSAHCRDEKGTYEDVCTRKLIESYGGFLPHMQRY